MYSQAYVSHLTILVSVAHSRLDYLKRVAWEDCGAYLKTNTFFQIGGKVNALVQPLL